VRSCLLGGEVAVLLVGSGFEPAKVGSPVMHRQSIALLMQTSCPAATGISQTPPVDPEPDRLRRFRESKAEAPDAAGGGP
jgi:hypothetical protein